MDNKYTRKELGLVTSISGGRRHHTYRQPVRAITTYDYDLTFAENYHTLSAIIFGSDKYYWAISDMNKPIDGFNMVAGQTIKLPEGIVRNINGVEKFV